MSAFCANASRSLRNLASDVWSVLSGRRPQRADRRASFRPAVETLEHRFVPTTSMKPFSELGVAAPAAFASMTVKQMAISGPSENAVAVSNAPLSFLPGTSNWFLVDFQDDGIRTVAQTEFQRDKMITRNDLLAVFSQAEGDGIVSASELADLKFMIANASTLKMPEYVRYLGDKVVNGDPANATFQSLGAFDGGTADVAVTALGDLQAGSSAVQLTELVNKWFYGMDLPTTAVTDPSDGSTTSFLYAYDSVGTLFGSGAGSVGPFDIHQGDTGDCWLLAAAADVAKQAPATLRKMFVDNGDGTFTVHLFTATGASSFVTVNRWLPETSDGNFIFAGQGQSLSDPNAKLWAPLFEKAVAQFNHSGLLDSSRDGTNSYQGLSSGYGGYGMIYITGLTQGTVGNALNQASLNAAITSGKLVTLLSQGADTDPLQTVDMWNVVPNHEYAVLNYKPSTGIYTLFNPWGTLNSNANVEIGVNWKQLTDIFLSYDTGANPRTTVAARSAIGPSIMAAVLAGADSMVPSASAAPIAPCRSALESGDAKHVEQAPASFHVATGPKRAESRFEIGASHAKRQTIAPSAFDAFWSEAGRSLTA